MPLRIRKYHLLNGEKLPNRLFKEKSGYLWLNKKQYYEHGKNGVDFFIRYGELHND